jgi:hypothetical protein
LSLHTSRGAAEEAGNRGRQDEGFYTIGHAFTFLNRVPSCLPKSGFEENRSSRIAVNRSFISPPAGKAYVGYRLSVFDN